MVLKKDYPYVLLAVVLAALAAMVAADFSESVGTYALIGIIGIGVVLGIVVKPSLGGYILVIAVFSNFSSLLTDNGLPGIIKPLVAVIFVALVIRNFYIGQILMDRPRTVRVEFFIIAYFMAVAASYLVATDRSLTLDRIIDLVKDIVIVYCILFCIRQPQEWKFATLAMVLVITVVCLLGVYQVVTGNYAQDFYGAAHVDRDLRLSGPVYDANFWGQILVAVIPFAIFGFLRESVNMKLLYAGAFVLVGIVLLNTYSRGAYLAFLIMAFLIMVFHARANIWLVSSIAAGLFLLMSVLPASYADRLQTLTALSSSDGSGVYQDLSLRGRSSEMLAGFAMFTDHPILGVGAGNYSLNYQKYAQVIGLEYRSREREAHSLYLEILAETGLFGFLSFIGIVFFLFTGLARIKKELSYTKYYKEWYYHVSAVQIAFVGYLFAAIFLHDAYIRYFWILTGLALALIQILHELMNSRNYSNHRDKPAQP